MKSRVCGRIVYGEDRAGEGKSFFMLFCVYSVRAVFFRRRFLYAGIHELLCTVLSKH